jgi:hypothetical protein
MGGMGFLSEQKKMTLIKEKWRYYKKIMIPIEKRKMAL